MKTKIFALVIPLCALILTSGCSMFTGRTPEQNANRIYLLSREATYATLMALGSDDRVKAVTIVGMTAQTALNLLDEEDNILSSENIWKLLGSVPEEYRGLIELGMNEVLTAAKIDIGDVIDEEHKIYFVALFNGIKDGSDRISL